MLLLRVCAKFWYDVVAASVDNSESRKAAVDFELINHYVSGDY
jgi:hypothetical protein